MELGQSEREYRSIGYKAYFGLGGLVIMTLVALLVAYAGGAQFLGIGFFCIALLAWFWFKALFRIVYRVRVSGDEVEFKSIARTRRTRLECIRSIRSERAEMVTIRFDGGRADVLPLDGLHDFVSRVQSANSGVKLSV